MDYIFTTRIASYSEAVQGNKSTIVTSNVSKGGRGKAMVIDYNRWITVDETTHDSSGIIALNLLEYIHPKRIFMARFDGFSRDINNNYYDPDLRKPDTEAGVKQKNMYYSRFIAEKGKKVWTYSLLRQQNIMCKCSVYA